MDIRARFAQVAALAEHYEDFVEFAIDGMAFLGFSTTCDVTLTVIEFE